MSHCAFALWHFFFFNDTATTEIYTLSLHDALPILSLEEAVENLIEAARTAFGHPEQTAARRKTDNTGYRDQSTAKFGADQDRKSTRLNSSHANISYAVFCLKKKNN